MLYLLQFACLIFMFISAFFIAATRLHVRWINRRYECSRWMIFSTLLFMGVHYFLQMYCGFRAMGENVGAVINMLVYMPSFTLISMAIYNIEATHMKRRNMYVVCAAVYAAMLSVFVTGFSLAGSLDIGVWMYVMHVLFFANVVYCIYMIVKEMRKRKQILETMAATDMLPFIRYARTSVFMLLLTAVSIPFAILSTKLLYVVGPLGLLMALFFIVNFVAIGYSYVPTEELLENEQGNSETDEEEAAVESSAQLSAPGYEQASQHLSSERIAFIQAALDKWCADMGYKDSSVNMLTLSHLLDINKNELTQFFSQCQNTTFRIWLSEIRFNAAKRMMMEYPDYSNDIISSECGFSSRSYLYRVFKEKEGCTPIAWRDKQA
jgi:AraC-like DNA-binding protein